MYLCQVCKNKWKSLNKNINKSEAWWQERVEVLSAPDTGVTRHLVAEEEEEVSLLTSTNFEGDKY